MNKVVLMGRLTKDPEVRYTQTNNTLVANFSWSKTGEFCSKYFKKGQQVGVIGRIQTRNWEDENNQKHYITEVVAEEAYFADSKRDGEANSSFANTFGNSVSEASEFAVSSDDDLPF